MPGGKVHRQLWKKYLFAPIIAAALLAISHPWVSLTIMVGYVLARWIEPDLDQIGITTSEADWIRSVILIPFVAWSTLYARCIQVVGGHRSFWSHFPFIGTLIRLLWFSAPILIALHLFGIHMPPSSDLYFMGLWFGMGMADTIHALADWQSGEI